MGFHPFISPATGPGRRKWPGFEPAWQSGHSSFRNGRHPMKPLAAAVCGTYLFLVWAGAPAHADEKRQLAQNGTEGASSAAAGRKPLAVEVRFTDNSLLKLKLEDERLEFL